MAHHENDRIPPASDGLPNSPTGATSPGYFASYFTGRWYAIWYLSAGTTTSAVSTGRPDA